MYAVVESGGKQYRVQPGDVLHVEKLDGEIGKSVSFDKVLFLAKPTEENSQVWLGKPYVTGATVQGEVVGQGRGDKILIIKMKRRKQYRRTQGHRQFYTQLLVTSVDNGAGEKVVLNETEKKEKLAKFHSYLTPKGPAFSVPIVGSRKRLAAKKQAKTSTEKKTDK